MFVNLLEDIERHVKTHSEHSAEDKASVAVLEYFLRSNGKINTNFASNDKWPNTDGTFEIVPNPRESRKPTQNFIVQIKGTANCNIGNDGIIRYQLQSLAFPAYIAKEVTLDSGILFIVINPQTREKQRVFWKYISPTFLASIDFKKGSVYLSLQPTDEIFNSDDSINSFVNQLVEISENHSFVMQLERREFKQEDIIKVILARSNNINDAIEAGNILSQDRDTISRKIYTELYDMCRGALLLNGLRFLSPINLGTSWELALTDINTKFLSNFFLGLKYVDLRIPEDGQTERLILKYYNFLWKIRKFVFDYYNISILENLESFPRKINQEDVLFYEAIASAIELSTIERSPWSSTRYYVQKKKAFYVGTNRYFEITLQLVGKYATKYNRLTVYSRIDISTKYSIQICFSEINVHLWEQPSTIKVISNWRVSIEPYVLNQLAFILRKQTKISAKYNEYNSLMGFLTKTGITLLDLIDFHDTVFFNQLDLIYKSQSTSYYREIIILLREQFSSKSPILFGKNTIRYFLLNLKREIVDNISSYILYQNLYISKRCIPFERNPLIYNLPKHKTNNHYANRDVVRAVGFNTVNKYLPYIRLKQLISKTGEMFFKKQEIILSNKATIISDYNNMLSPWDKSQGMLLNEDNGYVYIENYVQETVSILRKLIYLSQTGNDGQKQLNANFLKEIANDEIDNSKKSALVNAFVDSNVLSIYGAAGTGKTTLMDYLSNLFKGRSKLFLSKTHTALDNLKKRITNPGSDSQFDTVDSTIRTLHKKVFDIVFIDECSTIDNRTMHQLLKVIDDSSLIILAGDIYQIESIEFGNWFFYAKDILPKKSVVELTSTWRTKSESLKSLWEEVRFKQPLITEKLVIDGPFSEQLGNQLFTRTDNDEVVLCLNYDGHFVLNSINDYFQEANPSKEVFTWEEWKFKKGDPILFNENVRFPMLYNNLKGEIIDISAEPEKITFLVDVDILLTDLDFKHTDCERISSSETKTRIRFSVNKYDNSEESDIDDSQINSIIPFQLAYAVSIHKAQGLEYNSIKIVIPDSVSERITHGIFYTAITRAKEKLKIFWSAETMQKIIKNFEESNIEKVSLEKIKAIIQSSR